MDRAALLAGMEAAAAAAAKPMPVEVPEWGSTVYVRSTLTVADIEEMPVAGEKGTRRAISRSAARVLCDEAGALLFDPAKEEDIAFLPLSRGRPCSASTPRSRRPTPLDAAAVDDAGNG